MYGGGGAVIRVKSRVYMGKGEGASDRGEIKSVHGGRGPVIGGGGIKSLVVTNILAIY